MIHYMKAAKPKKEKESLVEWIIRTRQEDPPLAPKPRPPPKRAVSLPANSPRLVPLRVWGQLVFGEYAPHYNTLIKWCRDGRIQPQPQKAGKKWYVQPHAEYRAD
jgi:hypothetical protein